MRPYSTSFLFILLAGIHTCSWTAHHTETTHKSSTRTKTHNTSENDEKRLEKIAIPLSVAVALLAAGYYGYNQGWFDNTTDHSSKSSKYSPQPSADVNSPFSPIIIPTPVSDQSSATIKPSGEAGANTSGQTPIQPTLTGEKKNKAQELSVCYYTQFFQVLKPNIRKGIENTFKVIHNNLCTQCTMIGKDEILDDNDTRTPFVFWKSQLSMLYYAMSLAEYERYSTSTNIIYNMRDEYTLYCLELPDFEDNRLTISSQIFFYEIQGWKSKLETSLQETKNTYNDFGTKVLACKNVLRNQLFEEWPTQTDNERQRNLNVLISAIRACKSKARNTLPEVPANTHSLHLSDPIPLLQGIVTRMQERNKAKQMTQFIEHYDPIFETKQSL